MSPGPAFTMARLFLAANVLVLSGSMELREEILSSSDVGMNATATTSFLSEAETQTAAVCLATAKAELESAKHDALVAAEQVAIAESKVRQLEEAKRNKNPEEFP